MTTREISDSRVFDRFVSRRRDELVEELSRFVAIPSVASDDEATAAAAEFLCDRLAQAGVAARIRTAEAGGRPLVTGEAGPDDAPLTVLIYGHYDVFPADEPEWRTDPWTATVDGDRIYGRGTGDNKGQILAYVHALRALHESGAEPPVKVKFLVEGEEETGSPTLPHFAREARDDLEADLCLYSDGPLFPNGQPVLLFGVRGAVGLELVAEGPARNVHSGNFGGVVPNPILDLCHVFAELLDRDGTIAEASLLAGVEPPSPSEREALARLPLDRDAFVRELRVEPQTGSDPVAFHERLMCHPNFNVAGLQGGHAGEGFKPIVPARASAKVDVRLVGDQDPDQVVEAVQGFLRERGYDRVSVQKLFGQPPSTTSLDHPYAEAIRQGVREAFGVAPLDVPRLAGTTPDYVFTKILGMPSIVVPLAPHDESNHAPNESTTISLYLTGVRAAGAILGALAERGRTA
jgi:acetylornithine deacetylase/succinyl-diaminopimelate desuccinylase-like protein